MPKPSNIDDDLQALIAAAGPPEAPADLGNLPADENEGTLAGATALEETPEEPKTARDEEPAEVEAAEPTAYEQRMAALEERLASRERELDLIRAGHVAQPQQPQAAPDPIDLIRQYMPGEVTAADVEAVLSDPVKGAAYMTALMRAAALGGARMALDASRAEVDAKLKTADEGRSLRERFWAENDDLQPYGKLVQQFATEAYNEGVREQSALIRETAKRVRSQLSEWGVKLPARDAAAPKGAVARRRITPAFAEGSRASGGKPVVNQFEKELFQLFQAR